MSDIEIIIVDDYSFDNSLEIIRELQIEDDRIKILSNKMNRGALYTKCIGFLADMFYHWTVMIYLLIKIYLTFAISML